MSTALRSNKPFSSASEHISTALAKQWYHFRASNAAIPLLNRKTLVVPTYSTAQYKCIVKHAHPRTPGYTLEKASHVA